MASKGTKCVTPSKRLAVSEANNHLAVQLYNLLAKEKNNVFFSPFSLSTALAMLFCGCRGETAGEMRQALGYESAKIEDQDVKSSFEHLLSTLEGESDGYTLTFANYVLSDSGFSVKQEFKSLLNDSFRALIQEVDFVKESEKAVEQVNTWVKEKTNNMIPHILNYIEPNTVMFILNAVYFKGFWLRQFKKEDTCLQYFYNKGIKKERKKVSMMHMKKSFPFMRKKTFKALQLPYKGKDICMLILLPKSLNGLDELECYLTSAFIRSLPRKMHKMDVEVALPKFRLEYSKDLKEQFKCLGMTRAFCEGADLGGINDSKALFVSKIIHKAVFEVNEEGAEASAVTKVVEKERCVFVDPEFIVDHPFLFFIYNLKTDLILFMGKVQDL